MKKRGLIHLISGVFPFSGCCAAHRPHIPKGNIPKCSLAAFLAGGTLFLARGTLFLAGIALLLAGISLFPSAGIAAGSGLSAVSRQKDTRPQRNGFRASECRPIECGGFTFQVPCYWEADPEREGQYYAESGGKSASLVIVEMDIPLYYLQFLPDLTPVLEEFNEGMNPVSYSVLDLHEINGIPAGCEEFRGNYTDEWGTDYPYGGYVYVFFHVDAMKSAVVNLAVSDNTDWNYDQDFLKIVESIRFSVPAAEGSAHSDGSDNSGDFYDSDDSDDFEESDDSGSAGTASSGSLQQTPEDPEETASAAFAADSADIPASLIVCPVTLADFLPLQEGDHGKAVRRVQERLAELQFLSGHAADGSFDAALTEAVSAYQAENHLEITGEVDENTYLSLFYTP